MRIQERHFTQADGGHAPRAAAGLAPFAFARLAPNMSDAGQAQNLIVRLFCDELEYVVPAPEAIATAT